MTPQDRNPSDPFASEADRDPIRLPSVAADSPVYTSIVRQRASRFCKQEIKTLMDTAQAHFADAGPVADLQRHIGPESR